MRQHREYQRERERDRDDLGHGLAKHLDDLDRQVHLHRVPETRRARQFAVEDYRAVVTAAGTRRGQLGVRTCSTALASE